VSGVRCQHNSKNRKVGQPAAAAGLDWQENGHRNNGIDTVHLLLYDIFVVDQSYVTR
jgi:hypothetical protein